MKVRIHKPHTHAGTQYHPGPDGLVLDLPEQAVAYIERVGAGTRVTSGHRSKRDRNTHESITPPNPEQ